MTDLRKWLTDNVLSYSCEEIIDPVPMQSVKRRRKLSLEKSRRFKKQDPEPTVCRTYIETPDGLWQPYTGKRFKGGKNSGTIVWHTGDPRAREESTTRAVIRHWHAWRGKEYLWASYLRVGERSGAHIMTAGGEVTTIARPPLAREPPEMVRVLMPDRRTGILTDITARHPDRGTWERWAEMIAAVRLYVQAQRDANSVVTAQSHGPFLRCTACGHWIKDGQTWRRLVGQYFCPNCYKRYDMRRQ